MKIMDLTVINNLIRELNNILNDYQTFGNKPYIYLAIVDTSEDNSLERKCGVNIDNLKSQNLLEIETLLKNLRFEATSSSLHMGLFNALDKLENLKIKIQKGEHK